MLACFHTSSLTLGTQGNLREVLGVDWGVCQLTNCFHPLVGKAIRVGPTKSARIRCWVTLSSPLKFHVLFSEYLHFDCERGSLRPLVVGLQGSEMAKNEKIG